MRTEPKKKRQELDRGALSLYLPTGYIVTSRPCLVRWAWIRVE